MKWREFDFRYSWTSEALEALDRGLAKCRDEIVDGIDLMEIGEELVGLGFVALQGYISGTVADLRLASPGKVSVQMLRARNCEVMTDVPKVEAIWAIANYYKHHEEWVDWSPVKGKNEDTVLVLNRVGIGATTEFPCLEMLKLLHPGGSALAELLADLSSWREAWFAELSSVDGSAQK